MQNPGFGILLTAILHSAFCLLHSLPSGPWSAVPLSHFSFLLSAFQLFPCRPWSLSRLCRSLVGALETHCRRIGGGFIVAISWLSTGLGVALMSHEGPLPDNSAFCILPSAFLVWWVASPPAAGMRDFHAFCLLPYLMRLQCVSGETPMRLAGIQHRFGLCN